MLLPLGTGRTGLGRGGWGGSPYAGAKQSKIRGQQREMHSTAEVPRHFIMLVPLKPHFLEHTSKYTLPEFDILERTLHWFAFTSYFLT